MITAQMSLRSSVHFVRGFRPTESPAVASWPIDGWIAAGCSSANGLAQRLVS